ncbi:MAG: helix-turn-helix transcriptional regulator [Treponema sp.]|nr:helix-turn-helix transcriptional regulator [Treponema sp.]
MKETLRALRERNNYSQVAIASFLGISRQMYIKYESGDAVPPSKTVVALSNLYGVPYEVILDDRLNSADSENQGAEDAVYKIDDSSPMEVQSPSAVQESPCTNMSCYLKSVLEMLPKLLYNEQLKVLAKLSGMIQKETEEKIQPDEKMDAYYRLLDFSDKLHLTSNGRRWTREELYER